LRRWIRLIGSSVELDRHPSRHPGDNVTIPLASAGDWTRFNCDLRSRHFRRVEVCIPSIRHSCRALDPVDQLGPLVEEFKLFDWIEGTRQQVLALAGIAVIAAVSWRATPMVVVAALSGAVYSLTAMVIHSRAPRRARQCDPPHWQQ